MTDEKMNRKFEIPLEQIEDMIGARINGDLKDYRVVVSPREITRVSQISYFREETFQRLIRKIPLRGHPDIFPYAESDINVFGVEPKGFEIGQKFILASKVLSIMSDLEGRIFEGFVTKGLSKMAPAQIYGITAQDERVIAFYIPPILEIHNQHAALIDGIHRSFICKSAGTTVNGVHINNVDAQLPFDPIKWIDTRLVPEKPPIEQRYRNLRTEYFGDLGAIGIDG